MPRYDYDGRLRILFADAYDSLAKAGAITREQAEAVKELIDRLNEIAADELERRLAEIFSARGAGG